MQFFKKEMWLGLQDNKRSEYWQKVWNRNIKAYKNHLYKLKPKLGKKNFHFFANHHLSGEYISNINIRNNGKMYFQDITNEINFINNNFNAVELNITTVCPKGYFYILKYKNVRRYILDYPSDCPLWFEGKNGLGSWGYDELRYLGTGSFRHEMLLHSGAVIIVEFKSFTYSRTKIESKLIKR